MKPARESTGLTYNQDMKELLQENKNYKFSASPVIGEAKGSFHLFLAHKSPEAVSVKPKQTAASHQCIHQELWGAEG